MWSAQAKAKRLTLLVADNKTGYFGVHLKKPTKSGQHKPYQAQVTRGQPGLILTRRSKRSTTCSLIV